MWKGWARIGLAGETGDCATLAPCLWASEREGCVGGGQPVAQDGARSELKVVTCGRGTPPKQAASAKMYHLTGATHAAEVTPSRTIERLETSNGTSRTVGA